MSPATPSKEYKARACTIAASPYDKSKTDLEHYLSRDNIYPAVKNIEISESLEEMYKIRKHFLIFTDAGKPIYSRYGDENVMAPFFATLSAVMPKIQSYFWDPSVHAKQNRNKLQMLRAKGFLVCFLKKGSLIYICLYNQGKRLANGEVFLDEQEIEQQATVYTDQSQLQYL